MCTSSVCSLLFALCNAKFINAPAFCSFFCSGQIKSGKLEEELLIGRGEKERELYNGVKTGSLPAKIKERRGCRAQLVFLDKMCVINFFPRGLI